MATYTVTNSFTANTTAVASQANQNFTDVLTALNSFDAANLSGSIAVARISGLTYAQCAASFFLDEDTMSSNSATAVASQQSIKAYVTSSIAAAVPDDDAFGTWASKSLGTAYLADSDGIATAFITNDQGLIGYTDSSNPPTTVRVRQGYSDYSTNSGLVMPVKKGDYYKISGTENNSGTMFWLPIGA